MRNRLGRIRSFTKEDRGVTAIEFAIVSPLLIMLMFGMMTMGHALFSVASVQWAVERSVRALMIDGSLTQADLEKSIQKSLSNLTNMEFTVHYVEDLTYAIPMVRVYTDIAYHVIIPLIPEFDISYRVETQVPRPFEG